MAQQALLLCSSLASKVGIYCIGCRGGVGHLLADPSGNAAVDRTNGVRDAKTGCGTQGCPSRTERGAEDATDATTNGAAQQAALDPEARPKDSL